MRTKVKGLHIGLTVAVVIGLFGVTRDARATLDNVPYKYNGKTLYAVPGSAGDAALFNGSYYFAYIAENGNGAELAVFADSNRGLSGQNVVYWYEIGQYVSPSGVALVPYNNMLYLFFVDDSEQRLWFITSADGLSWSSPYFVGGPPASYLPYFVTPPVAVVWENQILVYISGDSGNGTEGPLAQYNVYGTEASGPYNVGEGYTVTSRASATIWQGKLEVAIADASNNGEIGLLNYTDATGWSSELLTGLVGIPSIRPVDAGALNMVYRGNNQHIYVSFTGNGVTFSNPQEDTASTTNQSPVQFTDYSYGTNLVFYVGVNNALFTILEN